VAVIDEEVRKHAQGKNGRGRGGMASKLEAARIATEAGGLAVIANGRLPNVVERVCAGEIVGTFFAPRSTT
jgi:glutamate 5-kinase